MSQPLRTQLSSVLLGDELGQIKLVELDYRVNEKNIRNLGYLKGQNYNQRDRQNFSDLDRNCKNHDAHLYNTLGSPSKTTNCNDIKHENHHRHRIVRILDDCLQQQPAASRSITTIRPLENVHQSNLDTTDKPNNLFLIANKVGQIFICDTNAVRRRIQSLEKSEFKFKPTSYNDGASDEGFIHEYDEDSHNPMLSPVYYNSNNKVPVTGGQPINQTGILVIYQNGDIQHVNIGQEILRSSLKIRRKAIRLLGLGYNSDAKAIHWRLDGSNGICYFDSDASSTHMNENDPLTDIVLSSPTHRVNTKYQNNRCQDNQYHQSPCIQSRKYNEQDKLVPTQVINMISSRPEQYKTKSRMCKWSSITSLNLIYRKLALYDLVGSENFEISQNLPEYQVNCYKLNDNRLAVGGYKYTARVYDVQTQKAIFNCKTGANKNPLFCPSRGEQSVISDLDWLGGNKTTKRSPNMLALVSGVDSIVNVFDIRSSRPVFYIDLTQETENKWQPYDNQPKGCMFTHICASGAPYSTAVPSQQLVVGSTNGQLHIIDLRFVARSNRMLGRLSGFCGGSVREIRFVSETFETSKMISCATDRFIRIHKIQTSFTSVISQRLATKIFLGTKPTCIQPVCDEITQSYLANIVSRCGSESHISTVDSASWSLL